MYETGSFVGDYRLEEIIAHGGMGTIWKAIDVRDNQWVAIKVIANDLMGDPNFRLRIQDEARRHQHLVHPNIVRVLAVMEYLDNTWIVMELINGESLATVLETEPYQRMPEARARHIIRDILSGLNYAHSEHAIWHRDIKPSNIILDSSDHVHIIDFGIALAYGEDRRTRTGQMIGTPDYMSPEQITRPNDINHLTDVYSVGCVLYEMLTGRPPFVRGEEDIRNAEYAVQAAHVNKRPVPPKERVPEISDDMNKIVMDALEKDFETRIPGCGAFLLRLEQPSLARVRKTKRVFAWPWIVGAASILLLLIALIYSVV